MADTIKKLTIEGFRSIRKLDDFELGALNVLIGPNGAGKSNFVGFFRLLRELINRRLQVELQRIEGGADACLYLGPKITEQLAAKLYFGDKEYEFSLLPTPANELVFSDEAMMTFFENHGEGRVSFGSGHFEAKLKDRKNEGSDLAGRIFNALSSWVVYHFDDTSLNAAVRRPRALNDNDSLRQNAENLAPFLYRIMVKDRAVYTRIRDLVRLAAPFFDDFNLRPIPTSPNEIQLEWRQKNSDYPFRANQLSDGTLRFICLATALLQPSPPPTMLFDEPELGLHPYALTLLGNLFKQVTEADGTQVIISTQSAQLLNEFAPEDIIVVERSNSESTFRRLKPEDLSEWLEDYTLGELWQKNILGGRPRQNRSLEPVSEGR
ncbi:MAG: AAA family ATPase [Bryobacteraceae bacterium]